MEAKNCELQSDSRKKVFNFLPIYILKEHRGKPSLPVQQHFLELHKASSIFLILSTTVPFYFFQLFFT